MKKWASIFLFFGVLPCLTLRAATVTFNGATTYQTIDGFGVNVNHRSWNNEELKPALNALIDQAGMTLFRVIFDNTNWEATNDNADPTVMNWTYYNSIYGSSKFTPLWNIVAYLNSRGLTNGVFFNFMGSGPSWMGGGALTSGLEAEWAEMIASLLTYARKTKGLQFHLVAPNNEPDISNEGIRIPTASQYTKTLYQLAQLLDGNGMSDVRFVAPDLAGGGTTYMPQLMANSTVMAKLERFGAHSYSDNGGGSAGIYDYIRNSAYPSRAFWMTEFNVWCNTCDSGTRGTYDWSYCRGTADYLLHHLENGAAAGIIWEGYDSFYAHYPSAWSFWGLLSVDNQNAAVKTYTPRKNFYTVAQISKFVRPGARRLGVSGATSPFSPLLAFSHSDLGQVAIVGINTSGSAATLNGTLASLPSISYLDLYYTSVSANLASAGRVTVGSGKFSATIPANCVFTLTGSRGIPVAITNPVNGTRFNAPANIRIAAVASTTAGSISKVEFYNGSTKLGEDKTVPYEFAWSGVSMGEYSLTARATDSAGNISTSAAVAITVVGPIAQIAVTPSSAIVAQGYGQQFTAAAADRLGHALDPQPTFSWSVSGGGTIDHAGLFTAGSSSGGPFYVIANSGGITGTATVSVTALNVSGGTIGNTNEGTLTDALWSNGAWINACRFQAVSNIMVSTIKAKVVAISGRYKCALYTDNKGQPSRLLGETAQVSNPSSGWRVFPLTSSLVLSNGNYYWLAIWSDHANAKVYYSDTRGTLRWGPYSYSAWPDPIITTGGGNLKLCIYATSTNKNISLTTPSAQPAIATTWSDTTTPSLADSGPDSAAELGVKFRSDVAGKITGIRFYKAGANTGVHIGNLWSIAGARLGTVTFSNETASGWQQAFFAAPVSISSNTMYVASYHANNGHYSGDLNYFQGKGVDNPPLHALADGVADGNGVYAYGTSSAFPNQTWYAANYWVDVIFEASP